MSDWRKFYYCFGVKLEGKGSQIGGACPFCLKGDKHFTVRTADEEKVGGKTRAPGMYHCKKCGESGNHFNFINAILNKSAPKQFVPSYYDELVEAKGLMAETFWEFSVVRSLVNGQWLLPSFNTMGKLCNLYRVDQDEKEGKLIIKSAASPIEQQLYRMNKLTKETETVYLVEGHWDTMAFSEVVAHLTSRGTQVVLKPKPDYNCPLSQKVAVIGLPGACTIKDTWFRSFKKKGLVVCFDNDQAGESAFSRFHQGINASKHKPHSLKKLNWRTGDVNDLRDLLLKV